MKKRNFIGRQVGKRRNELDDLTQLFYLAVALRVHPIHFLPKMDWSKPVKAQIYSQ